MTGMSEATDKLKKSANDMVAELQQARDEVRVQLHLAGMETKDYYGQLEKKLTAFESRVHQIGDEPAHEVVEAFDHLLSAFRKLGDNLSS